MSKTNVVITNPDRQYEPYTESHPMPVTIKGGGGGSGGDATKAEQVLQTTALNQIITNQAYEATKDNQVLQTAALNQIATNQSLLSTTANQVVSNSILGALSLKVNNGSTTGTISTQDSGLSFDITKGTDSSEDLPDGTSTTSRTILAGVNNAGNPSSINCLKVDGAGCISVAQKINLNDTLSNVVIPATSFGNVITLNFNAKTVVVTVMCNTQPNDLGMTMSDTVDGTQYPIWNKLTYGYTFSFQQPGGTGQYISTLKYAGPIPRYLKFHNMEATAVTLDNILITYDQA